MAKNNGAQLLQEQTRAYLIDRIQRGDYRTGDTVPTFQELAASLNTSTSVAFRAVKTMCNEGWLEQGEKRRHIVSPNAKHLVVRKKNANIAFSSRGIDHILLHTYQGIFNYLTRMGEALNINFDCILELDEDGRKRAMEADYDAIIVADWQSHTKNDQIPVISLDLWENRKADFLIMSDNFEGGRIMGRYLYGDKGYRKAVYWDAATKNARMLRCMAQRRLGFLKGWIDEGGHLDEVKTMEIQDRNQDIRPMVKEVLDTDVFFICSDEWAMKIWDILAHDGVKVPTDVALAGFDGTYEALTHKPPLTTIKQPYDEIATKIIDIIVHILSRTNITQKEWIVQPTLSIGGST